MTPPGALEYDIQRIVQLIEDERAEPPEGQKDDPAYAFQGADPMELLGYVFAQGRQEAFQEAEQKLFADALLGYQETDAVQQEKHEGKEGQQGEERQRGGQACAPMALEGLGDV